MVPAELLKDLTDFLRSSATNVEWMSDTLRSELNVPTGLDAVMRAALDERRSIAIAGTAGSGKTHLLSRLNIPSGYRVITDLAPLPEGEWKSVFTRKTP